jgi:GT2 family glycosyltransferase
MEKISVVIPAYIVNNNLFQMTKKCIDKVTMWQHAVQTEVIVVDDGSPCRDYIRLLKKTCPSARWVHNSKNLGFAHSVNRGIAKSSYDLILLLNNDVDILDQSLLHKMAIIMTENKWDLISPATGWLDDECNYIPYKQRPFVDRRRVFEYAQGWCMLMSRALVESVGLLPTDFGKGFFEDTLFCRIIKTKTDFKFGYAPELGESFIKHKEHATFKAAGYDLSKEYLDKRKIYMEIIEGKRQCILPKIHDYFDDTKY